MQSDKAASYWMKAKLTETHVTSKCETNEHTSAQPTASERGSSESITGYPVHIYEPEKGNIVEMNQSISVQIVITYQSIPNFK